MTIQGMSGARRNAAAGKFAAGHGGNHCPCCRVHNARAARRYKRRRARLALAAEVVQA